MIKFLINKITGKKSKKEIRDEEFASKIFAESSKISGFINNIIKNIINEIKTIRNKSKNLLETNYQLGLSHIQKGNLNDAKLRFAIIIRFWPNFHEAYYQKAYVEMLLKKPFEAMETINKFELNSKDVLDSRFLDLKNQIELAINNELSNEENSPKE